MVDAVEVRDCEQGAEGGLLGGLAGEEARGGGREDQSDGERRVGGERVQDEGDLDGGDAAAGGEEEVLFTVGGVGGGEEGGEGRLRGGGRRAGHVVFRLMFRIAVLLLLISMHRACG